MCDYCGTDVEQHSYAEKAHCVKQLALFQANPEWVVAS